MQRVKIYGMPDSDGACPFEQDLINSAHNVTGTDNVKTTICSLGYDAV
jgi:hypothetical protein